MVPVNVGERVGAIKCAGNGVIEFYGFGVYEGFFEHPEFGLHNPKILLDSGDVIWGLECFWGSEENIRKKIEGYDKCVTIPVPSKKGEDSGSE